MDYFVQIKCILYIRNEKIMQMKTFNFNHPAFM